VFRRIDPQPNLASLHGEHGYGDLVADHDRWSGSRKYYGW
jgi:hypothetical protein